MKIEIDWKLLSSLSHIGESNGPDSFLNTQSIVKNGKIEEVFVYSGNAIRGILRDSGAKYLLGGKKVSNDIFYLLFSGGNIAGEQKTNIKLAGEIKQKYPFISLFGGGIGTALLSGILKVSDAYPICQECSEIVPEKYLDRCTLNWGQLSSDRSYTRMDDTKNNKLQKFMETEEQKEKKKGEASTQMRYNVEVLNAGSELWSQILLEEPTESEIGCLISCFVEFFKYPFIGGKSNVGMGRFQADSTLDDVKFISIDKDGKINLSDQAKRYLSVYDNHIFENKIEDLKL